MNYSNLEQRSELKQLMKEMGYVVHIRNLIEKCDAKFEFMLL